MANRRALTLVEMLVVLVIVAALIGLLIPAVQSARRSAREAVCKNNLHQLNLAVAAYAQAHKRLPAPNQANKVGGWTIEILPFIEQSNLEQHVTYEVAIEDAPELLLRPPTIFRCPIREAIDGRSGLSMMPGHYVLVATDRRDSFSLYDVPLEIAIPWAAGPEMEPHSVRKLVGPHHDGFFSAHGFQQGVYFEPHEQ